MPTTPDDVLNLLRATYRAIQILEQPLISISMGALGVLTRIAGWQYGSSVTYAVGHGSSAPGQIPIEDVRRVQEILRGVVTDG